jgi:hypothetical protein
MPAPLLITEKQILAVRRVDAGPVPLRLFDGRHRRMLMAGVRDAEFRQPGEDRDLLWREHPLDYRRDRPLLTLWRHTTYRETS